MLSFKQFIVEAAESGPSSNDRGVMHELLVGKHLNGGKHMDHHPDANGDSPKQAHDKLKSKFSSEEYKKMNDNAKHAAKDIHEKIGHHGNVQSVHWTSKPGDLHRSTGIHASQKEDASDVVVTTKHPKTKKVTHHGVSLKVLDRNSGHAPVSNSGIEATHGGEKLLDAHREKLKAAYPALGKATNKAARKEWSKKNPKAAEKIKKANTEALQAVAKHAVKKMQAMPSHELAEHIRKHILRSEQTPMQKAGHTHMRHTTYANGSTHSVDPSSSHEHILRDHKNISVSHSGSSVVYSYNNKPFLRHRMKFESQSDPLSSIKGSGELMGSSKDH